MSLDECTIDFVRAVEQIGPFGIGFAKPVFTLVLDKLPTIEALGGSGEHIKLVGPK
jgi:single-stranded DNA-specific DHH superfamily exonuclease